MARVVLHYIDKERCSGGAVRTHDHTWNSWAFRCAPDGRAQWMMGGGPIPIPLDVRDAVERHCSANCRAPKWRRPGAASLHGCRRLR